MIGGVFNMAYSKNRQVPIQNEPNNLYMATSINNVNNLNTGYNSGNTGYGVNKYGYNDNNNIRMTN